MTKGKANSPYIGIFGRRNYGKSSFINIITGQDIAIVSEIAGTTTDPVKKSIEIAGIGPCVLVDTAGTDDTGELGEKRVKATRKAISTIDMAILIINRNTWGKEEVELVNQFGDYHVPFIIVHNKSDLEDLKPEMKERLERELDTKVIDFSVLQPEIGPVVQLIRSTIPESAYKLNTLIGDLISEGDTVLLITPIDNEAPEGRLILPQVQLIRDVLDNDAMAVVLKEREVDHYFRTSNIKPALAVTDSQVFLKAGASVPEDVPLTSFSIVLARQRGDFSAYLEGTPHISELKEGDRILILESCTHHVSCDDIGRVKIPRWLSRFTGKQLEFDVVSGLASLTRPIEDYSLVVQCGGCVITAKQIAGRLEPAKKRHIPVTNYGMCIAYCMGIYDRAIAPFVKRESDFRTYL
jgi:[FeFe] hydrogenase H-cluster maturation GTPase HydF